MHGQPLACQATQHSSQLRLGHQVLQGGKAYFSMLTIYSRLSMLVEVLQAELQQATTARARW